MDYYYTHIPKRVHCPKWDMDITIIGKYYFLNENDPLEGTFRKAICPIIKNQVLPLEKQEREFKILRCLEYDKCPYLNDFPEKVNVHEVTRIE